MCKVIRVLLVDDHRLLLQTLQRLLDAQSDIEVVGTANNADEAIERVKETQPDVLLMDIDMPGQLCFDAARTIATLSPQTRIIYVSGFSSDRYIESAINSHAQGYVTKSESSDTIIEAVRSVAEGSVYFSPQILSRIVIDNRKARMATATLTRRSLLTPRELEIVQYLARGLSKKEIAQIMHLAVRTVDNHTTRLMSKLDIHDRVELTRYALREGLASL